MVFVHLLCMRTGKCATSDSSKYELNIGLDQSQFPQWLVKYFTCINASDLFIVCSNVAVCSSSSRIISAKLVDETDKCEVRVASLCHAGLTGDVDSQFTKLALTWTPVVALCTAHSPHLSNRHGQVTNLTITVTLISISCSS